MNVEGRNSIDFINDEIVKNRLMGKRRMTEKKEDKTYDLKKLCN